MSPEKKTNNETIDMWEFYRFLSKNIQYNHTQWVDNYKIFLSFNSFLLPAITALLGYALSYKLDNLRYVTIIPCVVGIVASWCGLGILQRIQVRANLLYFQLRRLEHDMPTLPLKPNTENYKYIFKNEDIKVEKYEVPFTQESSKGIKASKAYKYISYILIGCYIFIGFVGIWPLIEECYLAQIILELLKQLKSDVISLFC